MTTATAAVSVVIPAHDAARFVEAAIRSTLDQTVPPARVIVVDDGSTDATADVADAVDPRVTVIRREWQGVGRSRNVGIDAVDTDLLAFCDADDLWLPHKLERQLAALDRDRRLDAVFCLLDEFLDGVEPGESGVRAPLTGEPASLASCALLRRSVIDRVGRFADVQVGDWVGWWARARALEVTEHVVPEVLVRRRIHGGNNSLVRGTGGQAFLDIAREHLRQRRALGQT
jgi:glycosyltransferase involved in cell wall biosynthesis